VARKRIWDLAHGRSGDKGDICNIGLVARNPGAFGILCREVTAERVKQHFGALIKGSVTRYELPNVGALNFVCRGALDGGGTLSLRSDHLGKVMYTWLLHLEIEAGE
jgi:hypothetical protein